MEGSRPPWDFNWRITILNGLPSLSLPVLLLLGIVSLVRGIEKTPHHYQQQQHNHTNHSLEVTQSSPLVSPPHFPAFSATTSEAITSKISRFFCGTQGNDGVGHDEIVASRRYDDDGGIGLADGGDGILLVGEVEKDEGPVFGG